MIIRNNKTQINHREYGETQFYLSLCLLWLKFRNIFTLIIILTLSFLIPYNIFSQSPELVRNGSFEEHGVVKTVEFKLPNWNNYLFYNYMGLNPGVLLCDCNYKFTEVQKYIGLPTRSCLKKAFNDTSKCSYVQLYFVSHITNVNRTHIIDGRVPHCILLEIFTNKGIGTMITKEKKPYFSSNL